MNDRVYLLGPIFLLLLLAGILCTRKDLAVKALKLGFFGGAAASVGELLYYRDYWHPPVLYGIWILPAEDFIFGFAITALSFVMYPFLFRRNFGEREHPRRIKLYLLFFVASLFGMLFFNLYLGVNSIFVSSCELLILAIIMIAMRRDLLAAGVWSVAAGMVLIVPLYVVLFDIFAPQFWRDYWLLAATKWGVTILGNVPLTEVLWYVSWLLFASISYPFASGRGLHRRR